jgi:hypothetical protein
MNGAWKTPFHANALQIVAFRNPERIFRMSLNLSSALFEFSLLRRTNWTPLDYVPYDDQSVYLVLDDFRPRRRRLGEADVEGTDLEDPRFARRTLWKPRARGRVHHWAKMFSIRFGGCRPEIRQRCDLRLRDLPFFLEDFLDRYEGRYRDIQLLLPMRLD